MEPERDDQYDLMVLLDELETLREDLIEHGVSSLADVDRRIADLHKQLDRIEEKDGQEG